MQKILFTLIFLPLLYSVFLSGFNYRLDVDELYHSQVSYLFSKGYLPYKDIFSIFTPVFSLIIMPIFKIIGPSLDAVILSRLFMISLFSLRIILSFYLVRIIFGKSTSLIFLPLFLIEPLTTFSSMQIRPDNLALTLLPLGLILLIKKRPFLSGIALFFTLSASTKLLPAVGVIFFVAIIKRYYRLFIGFLVSAVVFLIPFVATNTLFELIKNTVIYPKIVTDALLYPTPFGFLLLPDNAFIFGLPGRPLTWMFLWSLPFLAGAGVFASLKTKANYFPFKVILAASLVLQYSALFFIKSVFSQYYLPANWLFLIFSSVALSEIFQKRLNLFLILIIPLVVIAIQANIERSKNNFYQNTNELTKRFNQIPINSYVFPNLLFHPPVYPVVAYDFIGDIPKIILDSFPPIEKALEDKKVPYLLLSDYYLSHLNPTTVTYIKNNYKRVEGDPELWLRK